MGCCQKQDPGQKALNQALDDAKDRELSISKVLLLGPGESGKSTLFKQMDHLYGKGFSEDDRKGFREAVHVNVITSIKKMSEYYDLFYEHKELKEKISDEADYARQMLVKVEELNSECIVPIQTFWTDPAIQEVYSMGPRYHLTDSTGYFFEQIETICRKDYIPSFQDIIRCRIRTTGIVELEFQVENHIFKLFDVGGQRNERKKWIHCFDQVTAVIFVAALSSYDQMLIEDDKVNRLIEAINLFDDICNGRWFRKTAMILFLNKKDLFAEKCQRIPISTLFPEYTGSTECTPSAQYIQNQFEQRNKAKKQVYTHLTCATATDNIKMVFTAIKDIIIRDGLRRTNGLV